MLRSRNLRAMSQHDELQSLSLGLFSGPASEASTLVGSEAPSDQKAPELAKLQSPILESGSTSFFGTEAYSESSEVAQHAHTLANGDGGEIAVPLEIELGIRR